MTSPARTTVEPDEAAPPGDAAARPALRVRLLGTVVRHRAGLVTGLVFLLLAGVLTHGLWPDPAHRVLALNPEDQTLYEWFLAADARILHGDFSLLSHRLNAPDGINMMANTTVIALGMAFAPVTLLFGPATTFALLAALNLAGTAIGWYLLFTRPLRAHPLAAALGAGLCGFGPGIVSQTNSHLHMTAQWLVPVIVALVVRLIRAADPAGRPGHRGADWRRVVTSGLGLAVAVTVQVFIGEEVLFLTALTLLMMTVTYAVVRPRLALRVLPGFLAGMMLAAGLALIVLAYPLWFQFAGPQGVSDGMFSPYYFSADLASWWTASPLSLIGSTAAAGLSTGPAEYNTFLGWPLLLLALACAGWLIRRPLVIACLVAGTLMAALSLGPVLVVNGHRTALAGPYRLLQDLPVVDGALPMRFALPLLPLIATVLVLALDRGLRTGPPRQRVLVVTLAAVALLPVVPAPLPTAERPPVPTFISAGHWRDCVRPGGVLVPVPLPTPREPGPMRWAAVADAGFGLPEGFFIGPYGRNGTAAMGVYKQPTSALLADVARTGEVPVVSDEQRQRAHRDAAYWGASCVVLADDAPHAQSLRTTLEQLYGPATRVADVWTWRVG